MTNNALKIGLSLISATERDISASSFCNLLFAPYYVKDKALVKEDED